MGGDNTPRSDLVNAAELLLRALWPSGISISTSLQLVKLNRDTYHNTSVMPNVDFVLFISLQIQTKRTLAM